MSKALKAAIEANDPEAVRQALKGVKAISRKLPGANKPLLSAREKGADKVLEVLFEAGAVAEKNEPQPGLGGAFCDDVDAAIAVLAKNPLIYSVRFADVRCIRPAMLHALRNFPSRRRPGSLGAGRASRRTASALAS